MGCSTSQSSTRASDFHDQYHLGEKLGCGSDAQVHACAKREGDEDAKLVAVKIIDLRGDVEIEGLKSEKRKARDEVRVWETIGDHPNCVKLHDTFHTKHFVYMVMEKCSSTLFQALEVMPELTERSLGCVFAQMLLGISHCHDVKVAHRDIKPENFLVGGENGQEIKLADFGMSVSLDKHGKIDVWSFGVTDDFGSLAFKSPEMLTKPWYDEKVDVWSFGVTVYVLLFGVYPYVPTSHGVMKKGAAAQRLLKEAIVSNVNPPSFKPVQMGLGPAALERSADTVSMVKDLLIRDHEERPSTRQALLSTWMLSALQDTHMIGTDLPSLRPMLHAATELGATAEFDPAHVTDVDRKMKALQSQKSRPTKSFEGDSSQSIVDTLGISSLNDNDSDISSVSGEGDVHECEVFV